MVQACKLLRSTNRGFEHYSSCFWMPDPMGRNWSQPPTGWHKTYVGLRWSHGRTLWERDAWDLPSPSHGASGLRIFDPQVVCLKNCSWVEVSTNPDIWHLTKPNIWPLTYPKIAKTIVARWLNKHLSDLRHGRQRRPSWHWRRWLTTNRCPVHVGTHQIIGFHGISSTEMMMIPSWFNGNFHGVSWWIHMNPIPLLLQEKHPRTLNVPKDVEIPYKTHGFWVLFIISGEVIICMDLFGLIPAVFPWNTHYFLRVIPTLRRFWHTIWKYTLRIPMTQFPGEELSWRKKPVIWRFDVLTLWSAIFHSIFNAVILSFCWSWQQCRWVSAKENSGLDTPNTYIIYLLPIPFFAASILATKGHMELLVKKVVEKKHPQTPNVDVLILCNLSIKQAISFWGRAGQTPWFPFVLKHLIYHQRSGHACLRPA